MTVLAGVAGAVGALLVNAKRLQGFKDGWLRRGIAVALLGNELLALGVAIAHGHPRVPLQLCDLALFLTVAALWNPRLGVTELAYFWVMTGGVQAALTPDVPRGFPDYWWVKFFLTHGGTIVSMAYLAVRGWVSPTPRSVWRVWAISNGYAAMAALVNGVGGTNYGYLAHKPYQPSLLDYCGPWPWYILVMDGVALVLLYLAYAPFVVARRLRAAACAS